MEKLIPILFLIFSAFGVCLAEDSNLDDMNQVLLNRAKLNMQMQDNSSSKTDMLYSGVLGDCFPHQQIMPVKVQ